MAQFSTPIKLGDQLDLNPSDLAISLNGHNATKALVSSFEISPGKFCKHVDVGFPFGRNSVTISGLSAVPEFPYPAVTIIGAILSLILTARRMRRIKDNEV